MKKIIKIILIISLPLFAQDITNKLGGDTANETYEVRNASGTLLFQIQGDGGALFVNNAMSGTIPMDGIGDRMMWYPAKGAFRAGYVSGTQWDDANIGNYSIALGNSTIASGQQSTALNYATIASGQASLATGYLTDATGSISTAMGYNTTASGNTSTAMGFETTASGENSTAIGIGTTASGDNSTALGQHTTASGVASTAMGNFVSTGNHPGSFIIGDNSGSSTDITSSDGDNQMMMIFTGGYRFLTNDDANVGASLAGGANSWTTISDSTKKENFQKVDGEYFLNSINKLKLGSWNYKAQDSSIRHYGPMAQEIYKYFGKDDFGTIGNDTTLATADMDGIMMIAIQALIKENKELKLEKDEEIAFLKSEIEELKQLIIGRE